MMLRMNRGALSPLVGALLTALAWTAPLPLTRLAMATDPLLVGALGIPVVLSVVVALAAWRRGWSRGSMLGGMLGAVAFVVLSVATAVVDTPRDVSLSQAGFGTLYVAIATGLAWLVGGALGRLLRNHFAGHTFSPSTAP